MTSLDDLLNYDESDERPARSGVDVLWWWLLKAALGCAAGALPILAFIRLLGFSVAYPLIFMIMFCLWMLYSLVRWVGVRPLPATLVRSSTELVSADQANGTGQDGLYLATARWDTRLAWAKLQNDKGQFARTVQPRLVGIIDERLRQRHGIARSTDPARARALLGEPLWKFVTVRPQRTCRRASSPA
jgi:hypothetical protein